MVYHITMKVFRMGPLAALLFLPALWGPLSLGAGESVPSADVFEPAPLSADKERLLEEVYESPDFGAEENYRKIQFKKKEAEERPPDGPKLKQFELPAFREILAQALRVLLGAAAAAALIAGTVYVYRRWGREYWGWGRFPLSSQKGLGGGGGARPLVLLEEAAALHRSGSIREAWARCFRAFCAAFEEIRFITFPPEATEYETLALVRNSGAPAPDFESFVRRWVQLAYGGRSPGAGSFEEALASCRSLLTAGNGGASGADAAGNTGEAP